MLFTCVGTNYLEILRLDRIIDKDGKPINEVMSFHWVSWEMCYVCLTCCLFQCLMFINVNISWSKARAVQTKMWHSVKPLTVGLVNQVDWSKLRGWVLRTYRCQWWETLCNILKDHSQKHRYTDFFNLPWDIEFSSCLVLFYPINSFSLEFPVPYFLLLLELISLLYLLR